MDCSLSRHSKPGCRHTTRCCPVLLPVCGQACRNVLSKCVLSMSCLLHAGWDVAATSDIMSEWGSDGFGMCGMCMEVRCKNMRFRDGYVSAGTCKALFSGACKMHGHMHACFFVTLHPCVSARAGLCWHARLQLTQQGHVGWVNACGKPMRVCVCVCAYVRGRVCRRVQSLTGPLCATTRQPVSSYK